ncbi:Transposable element P transposase [Aphis craccivora]|uniref:Transposable element P transposase n=1 Tax=Aphis craccivora TaxID=307492 RepID=A0A6G0VVK3_APHCR|nr:Transposable element P transposase [Aphis craccivora]
MFPQISIENEEGIKLKLSMTNVVFRYPYSLFNKEYLINYFISIAICGHTDLEADQSEHLIYFLHCNIRSAQSVFI